MFESILSTDGFPPRWNCGPTWRTEPWWGWLHIGSDVAIWAAYFAIPLVLLWLARKRKDIPFSRVVYLFAAFICACGLSHLVEAGIFYWPVYRLSGLVKFGTAAVSWVTVAALFPVVPKLLSLRSVSELEAEVGRRTRELSELAERLQEEVIRREEINDRLMESREMLQMALQAGDIGIFNWDLQTNEVVFDEAQCRLTGMEAGRQPLTANDFFRRIDPEYEAIVREVVANALEEDHTYSIRFPFVRPDGERIWLIGRGIFVHGREGKPVRLIGLNQDVTEQVQRESALDATAREAISASKQKSRFVAAVSHEIRTPLTAMLGCVDALLADLPRGDTRRVLRTVRSQGEMLRLLLNDVLDLSKIEAGKLVLQPQATEIVGLVEGVHSLMEPLATEQGLQLSWQAESRLPRSAMIDPLRVRQILLNLISNAIKYTSQGQVDVRVCWRALEAQQGELVIVVRDTGVGIPADRLGAIFQEYEQVKASQSGTGLGLAICYRLVHMMGGGMDVRSEEGIGSEFTVRIPVDGVGPDDLMDSHEPAESDEDAEPPEIVSYDLKVLAAEDTRAIQFVLRRLVGAMVRELKIVDDGRQAINAIHEAIAEGNPFNLVLMDIQMPEMSGTEAIRHLRGEGFGQPIAALTAGNLESERLACIQAGATYFLPKPIDIEALKRVLDEVAQEDRRGVS